MNAETVTNDMGQVNDEKGNWGREIGRKRPTLIGNLVLEM